MAIPRCPRNLSMSFGKRTKFPKIIIICVITVQVLFALRSYRRTQFKKNMEEIQETVKAEEEKEMEKERLVVDESFLNRSCGTHICLTVNKDSNLILDNSELSPLPYSKLKGQLINLVSRFTSEGGNYRKFMADAFTSERRLFATYENINPSFCNPHVVVSSSSASVIIPFFDDMWSMVLRTINSVLENTPQNLLKELILVDDFSSSGNLHRPLEEYLSVIPNVKLLRLKSRQGLMRARMIGAKAARAEVLVFLDAHVYCHAGWLEPLLNIIDRNRMTLAVPDVSHIQPHTSQIMAPSERMMHGSFTWELDYIWRRTEDSSTTPIITQTVIGYAMAVDRYHFFRLGGFDEAMEIWGGENLEISFKTWLCGGEVRISPCSQVSHLFRDFLPYSVHGDTIYKNLQRVALTWMDEYARNYFLTTGKVIPMSDEDLKSIRKRKSLAQSLGCKPFSWLMERLATEGLLPVPFRAVMTGQIKSLESGECLSVTWEERNVVFEPCHLLMNKQIFHFLSRTFHIVHGVSELCLEEHSTNMADIVRVAKCHNGKLRQVWMFDPLISDKIKSLVRGVDTRKPVGRLRVKEDDFNRCLTSKVQGESSLAAFEPCGEDQLSQIWVFTHQIHENKIKQIEDLMQKFED